MAHSQESLDHSDIPVKLRQALFVSRALLALERLWPFISTVFLIVALFLIYAWSTAASAFPASMRFVILAALALAILAIARRALLTKRPTQSDALRHVDDASPHQHRPAQTLLDHPSDVATTPVTQALWSAHRKIAREQAGLNIVAQWRSDLADRDPYALRYHIVLIAIVTGLLAGPEKFSRLASALSIKDQSAASLALPIEGWIDPPVYTDVPPLFLQFSSLPDDRTLKYRVPVGSVLVIRAAEKDTLSFAPDPQFEEIKSPNVESQTKETRWRIKGDGIFTLENQDYPKVILSVTMIPDLPPIVTFSGVREEKRGSLTLSYLLSDDYGFKSAEIQILGPITHSGTATRDIDPLISPPHLTLPLPRHAKEISAEYKILASMIPPAWQGSEVSVELIGEDEAGQVTKTTPFTITLPDHPHTSLLARALDEQGKILLQDAHQKNAVVSDLSLLSQTPELFGVQAGSHLGLRMVRRDIEQSTTRNSLRESGESLLTLAETVDQSFKSDTRRALDAARERLREAIDQKADKDTLQERLKEFREALDRYLEDYAKRALKQKPQSEKPSAQARPLRQRDLNALLDRMGDLMKKNGEVDPLFQSLESMLDALQSGENNPQLSEGDPSSDSENALDDMIRDQQKLRDETFRDTNRDQPSDQGALKDRQQALRDALEKMKEALKKNGMPGGDALDDAEQAMREAESSLGAGEGRNAVRQQEQALKSLRRGAKALADALDQNGKGQGRPGSVTGRNGTATQKDPFGRDVGKGSADEDLNQDFRAGSEQNRKLLDILKELQSRSSDPTRPIEERDYLKRLLDLDSGQ
ncbi:MAG: hypothetical protein RLZZ496_152 [Pseudomonadota bacterium]